jgi:hypothetical protein
MKATTAGVPTIMEQVVEKKIGESFEQKKQ